MKQCLVYYSKTGNTRNVAEKFNNFDLFEVKASSDNPNIQYPTLTFIPDITGYEYVIFATPVHGFQISKIMKIYLETIDSYKNKTIDLYITHFFPFSWMGGNSSLNQMKKIIESKGGVVRNMTSINWKNRKKNQIIQKMIDTYYA
jgi:flavodoxin